IIRAYRQSYAPLNLFTLMYHCNRVKVYGQVRYMSPIVCPEGVTDGSTVSLWTIMNKVRLEAIMWGAGTALGELPPYFMARAARLSGADLDDDEFEEIEELIHEKKEHPEELGFMEKSKLAVHNLVQKVGFFGILACASKLFSIFKIIYHQITQDVTTVQLLVLRNAIHVLGVSLFSEIKTDRKMNKQKQRYKRTGTRIKSQLSHLARRSNKTKLVVQCYHLVNLLGKEHLIKNQITVKYEIRECSGLKKKF
ncbi:Hypothetical predicted protein, partial [Mytilus galloprovincialis]